MAVVYFTSNASTGAGSLAEAIRNAQPGDVVRPDETVFERGSTIEIVLASQFAVNKNLTLDAAPCRVRLNGGGATKICVIGTDATVVINGFEFVGGNYDGAEYYAGGVRTDGAVVFERCRFAGCRSSVTGGALFVGAGGEATLNDCVVVGCASLGNGGGIAASGLVALNGSTVVGNCCAKEGGDLRFSKNSVYRVANSIVGNVSVSGGATLEVVSSVVDVASSSVGFVASPPDDLSVETWNANAWQNWDLRLLDDAGDVPSPYRDSGDVDQMSQYDVEGNFRGRETNGATTCSPGAYETLQADLFWVGVDATGATVETPSFLSADGWATSRFATASGDAAPQVGQKLFVDGSVSFGDVLSTVKDAFSKQFGLVLGGGANVRFPSATVYLSDLQTGADSTFTFATVRPNEARFGDRSRLDGTFAALPKYDVGSQVYIRSALLYSYARPEATYGVLTVYAQNSQALRLGGAYRCDEFRLYASVATSDVCAATAPGTTVRARVVKWGIASSTNVERLASEPITLILQDGASLILPDGAPESWADHFVVDLSEATSAALTLNGQTIYGDAPTAEITLNGAAKVDERGLDVASLTLNAGATLIVETATLNAETLTLTADSTLTVDGGNVCVAELSVADVANVAFSGVDAILTATETATVGDATFTGTGYFATPQGTDVTAATFAEDVRACDYGAGISAFSAVAISATEAAIEWSATDETATVCVERKTSSGWEVVDVRGESGLTAAIATPGATVFRAFDGAAFWIDTAWFLTGEQFTVETDFFAVAEDGAESVEYETETHIVTTNIDKTIYWGQSLTFLARIRNAFSGELLLNDGTRAKGVRYSLYRREGSLFSTSEDDVPVRLDVDAGVSCLLEAAQTSDAWPGVEYNFALIPANSADEPLIPAPGNYVLRVFVELATGNPIVFVYTFAAR